MGWLLIAVGIVVAMGLSEMAMGRLFLSKSGAIRLWVWETNGAETSQQIADWYSITHMLHGVFFYAVFWLIGRGKWSLGLLAVLATFAESAWEVFENCPFTIERYRAATAAVGYYGDSILNSVTDVLFCMAGFLVARVLPWWATLGLVVIEEVALAILVRDNLTLNIIMLIHPFEGIKQWQMGG